MKREKFFLLDIVEGGWISQWTNVLHAKMPLDLPKNMKIAEKIFPLQCF